MILCVDVDYRRDTACAAGVLFTAWAAPEPVNAVFTTVAVSEKYIPGQFNKRELPAILALLDRVAEVPEIIVVDGFVWLGPERKPGLGRYLHDALAPSVPVIGVAKRPFRSTPAETRIWRGKSAAPLYVTSVGIPLETAKECIRQMHGRFRIPTLLKRVDRICRGTWGLSGKNLEGEPPSPRPSP